MKTQQRFAEPVSIFVGLGFPYDVETAEQAYRVLNEWPGTKSLMHVRALQVCRSAIAGEADIEAARASFEAFARARGILAPDALAEAASDLSKDWLTA